MRGKGGPGKRVARMNVERKDYNYGTGLDRININKWSKE